MEGLVTKILAKNEFVDNVANNIAQESIKELIKRSQGESGIYSIYEIILEDLFVDYNCAEKNNEAMNIYKSKIFEGVEKSFTFEELQLLANSLQETKIKKIIYSELANYFDKKAKEEGTSKVTNYAYIDDYETYAMIFNEMAKSFVVSGTTIS